MKFYRLLVLLLVLAFSRAAPGAAAGVVTGSVFDPATGRPVEYVAVTLKSTTGAAAGRTAVSDRQGVFGWEHVPDGDYQVAYGAVGFDRQDSAVFTVDGSHRRLDLGRLPFAAAAIRMEKVEVSTRREAFYNSIDRKVYQVGKDIQSATGSASDLLQNIPSVQVDIEGNISLRGDENVLVLVDGKSSTAMGANRAAVLEQFPADMIERIEVITNPSAKYKPDGTAGIINLVLKKRHAPGYAGAVRVNLGTDRRANVNLTANYNPGPYNLHGNFSLRQDDRARVFESHRRHLDAATSTFITTDQHTVEHSRPLSRIAQVGVDFHPAEGTRLGFETNYNYRTFFREATQVNRTRDASGAVVSDYDRRRADPEFEKDVEFKATGEHDFAAAGRTLKLEVKRGHTTEQEDNHYTNVFRTPVTAPTFDNVRVTPDETNTEVSAEYERPLEGGAKLETGVSREDDRLDVDHLGTFVDNATGTLITDPVVTNRFIYESTLHALYGTYARPFGAFGLLAGLRLEEAVVDTNQVTAGLVNHQRYQRAYPTVHLSYNVDDANQLQLNYSHRVHRPEGEELNPYPQYQDPYNLRAGNPALVPEEIHSIEAGYQHKQEGLSYLATLYYRYQYHGFTSVTRYINSTTLLTTLDNLATSSSGGLELAASTDAGRRVSVNLSSNVFYNEIDGSNLGFSGHQSAVAWNAKLNVNLNVTKTTLVQANANYTAKRLLPQGYRLPTFVANLGLKREFPDRKLALVLTVTDLFDSLRERTRLETATLQDESSRRRSARTVYVGFVYSFGQGRKKPKDEPLPFDTAS